jgi:ribosomal protein S18 acetylase RimI-like enzyme
MNIVRIDRENMGLLEEFLRNDIPSTFRYFSTRTLDCIENHVITLLGVLDSTPVAYCHIDKDVHGTNWLGVCVLDKFQGKGCATQLINHAVQNTDIDIIHLSVDRGNINAMSLYRKLGFKFLLDETKPYYKMYLRLKYFKDN